MCRIHGSRLNLQFYNKKGIWAIINVIGFYITKFYAKFVQVLKYEYKRGFHTRILHLVVFINMQIDFNELASLRFWIAKIPFANAHTHTYTWHLIFIRVNNTPRNGYRISANKHTGLRNFTARARFNFFRGAENQTKTRKNPDTFVVLSTNRKRW